jgi:oxygen-dependent protoporphyrinogen oxidase
VSTIYARQLAWITDNQLPSLEYSEAVSIMLVNIWYPVPKLNFPHIGFGYLLPQALPAEANPECVLGVIFDSDREYPLPTPSNPDPPPRGADFRQGTKLTVMMGGHYWDDLPAACIPNEEEAQQVALRAVQRHLGIPDELTEKAHTQAKLCVCCIPQVLVGHAQRMKKAHGELEWAYKGRLAVAGQSYTNPGVVNCLRAGRDVAVHIAREHFPYELEPDRRRREEERKLGKSPTIVPEQETWPVGETGLQRFGTPPVFDGAANWAFPLRYGSKALVDEEGNLIYPLKEGDPPKM